MQELFLLHSTLSGVQSSPDTSLFLFPFVLPSYMEVSLSFGKPLVFCQHYVDVLCELFHLYMYFLCFCGEGTLHILLLCHLDCGPN